MVARGAHSAIILDHNVFERLDQPPRNVASFSSLDCCVNQTLAASHSVEVELSWTQTRKVAALDEALRLRPEVVLGEVRQRSLVEAKGDALSLNILLANTGHDLRNVDIASL